MLVSLIITIMVVVTAPLLAAVFSEPPIVGMVLLAAVSVHALVWRWLVECVGLEAPPEFREVSEDG
jgi:hypothetical protein